MEDLADVQTRHMDKVFEASKNIQAPDLISRAVYAINRAMFCITDAFHGERFESTPITKAVTKELLGHVKAAIDWATTLCYIEELDPPELEDVAGFADEFESEIAADAVLAALHVQRSLADYVLEFFCSDDNIVRPEEAAEYLSEVMACLELIARRLGSSVAELI